MITEEQRQQRRNGIGGSDVAAVMGLSPYITPYQLWLDKTGRIPVIPGLSEDRLRIRHAHEETIANEYGIRNNCKLRRANETIYHKKYPFMFCHLDRIVTGQRKIVECKSSVSFMIRMWGESGTDQIPINYILQIQHQMACAGYDETDVATLIDIDDFRIYHFKRDEEIIAKIEERCMLFWDHVTNDTPPEFSNKDDLLLAYPTSNGNFVEADTDILGKLDRFRELRAKAKELDMQTEKYKDEIAIYIKDAEGIKKDDEVLVTFKPTAKGNRVLRIREIAA